MFESLVSQAEANLAALASNAYVGRGIVNGLDETGQFLVQAAWTKGRGTGSRNRVYLNCGRGRVRTEVADPNKEKGDPSLTLYTVMDEEPRVRDYRYGLYVVSNGRQTDSVMEACGTRGGRWFPAGLGGFSYEDDPPIFTPRITAASLLYEDGRATAKMVMLRKSPFGTEACERHEHGFPALMPGLGYCLTTYSENGEPPPSFYGAPYLIPLKGDSKRSLAEGLWRALNEENRVSLVVKMVDRSGSWRPRRCVHIINKYERVIV